MRPITENIIEESTIEILQSQAGMGVCQWKRNFTKRVISEKSKEWHFQYQEQQKIQ